VLYFLRLITTDQRQVNHLVLRVLGELDRRLRLLRGETMGLEQQLAAAQRQRDELRAAMDAGHTRLAALHDGLARLAERQDGLAALHISQRLTALEGAIAERDRWFEQVTERLAGLETGVAERDRWFADLGVRDDRIQQALADVRETSAYLRGQIADRDRRIDALLSEVGAHRVTSGDSPPQPHQPLSQVEAKGTVPLLPAHRVTSGDSPPQPHEPLSQMEATGTVPMLPDEVLDAWAFVEAFRGDEATVREMQRRYVHFCLERGPVLDVGCGRGEFLELLRDAGVPARGIDLSNEMVLRCREKELDVSKADAISYLAALPDGSLGGIFCAQVVEHLPTAATLAFIRLAYAKLHADGVLIIETLNPEALLVHYRWFWMDPTHVRLVHPETLKFLLVSSGFRDLVGLSTPDREAAPMLPPLVLAGPPAELLERFNAATAHVNRLLHGDPDYAIVARR
jgi:SAM-dependent methyltransferase